MLVSLPVALNVILVSPFGSPLNAVPASASSVILFVVAVFPTPYFACMSVPVAVVDGQLIAMDVKIPVEQFVAVHPIARPFTRL